MRFAELLRGGDGFQVTDNAKRDIERLRGVIERVGKERNYYLIIEKRNAGVLYAASEADLTDEVIRAYDREAGSKKK